RLDPRLHDPVGDAIRLEVVGLRVVHGNEKRRTGGQTDGGTEANQVASDRQSGRPPHRPDEVPPFHDFGIAPFARSSTRRASGTNALLGYVRIRCSRCGIASAFWPRRTSRRAHSSSAAAGAAPSPPARTTSSKSAVAVCAWSPPLPAATCPASNRTSSRPPC